MDSRHLNADSNLVVPLRQTGQGNWIGISPSAPGQKSASGPFCASLRP